MNGIERPLAGVYKHTKNFRITFTFISLGILLGISSLALVANAQEDTTGVAGATSSRAELMEERMSERTEAQAQRRAQLSIRVAERITNLAANVSNRMEAAIARLGSIADRLESRMNKLEGNNVDITLARASLESAHMELAAARDSLSDIDVEVLAATGSENPIQAWQNTRATYKTAKEHIVTAHNLMKQTVLELKTAVQQAEFGNGASEAVRNETAENLNEGSEETATNTE